MNSSFFLELTYASIGPKMRITCPIRELQKWPRTLNNFIQALINAYSGFIPDTKWGLRVQTTQIHLPRSSQTLCKKLPTNQSS